MKSRDLFASASRWTTCGDWLRGVEKLYAKAGATLGQVAASAHDEALYLLLRTLDLPLDSDESVLKKKLTAAEHAKVTAVFRRRLVEHVPAGYLTREAWLGEHQFYVDERVIIPRSYFLEIIPEQLDGWLPDPKKVTHVVDVCTGSGACGGGDQRESAPAHEARDAPPQRRFRRRAGGEVRRDFEQPAL